MTRQLESSEHPYCLRCGREMQPDESLCSCWTPLAILEAGIDPAAYGYRQYEHQQQAMPAEPAEIIAVKPHENKSDWDIWEEVNSELLWQRGRIAQTEGQLAYLQKKIEAHLKPKTGITKAVSKGIEL